LVDFAIIVLKHLVSGFAWVINTVVDFIGFVSCNYLKLMMPAIPVLMAMRFAGKGLRGMLTGTVVGTLATWVAITAFTPECSMFKPVEVVTPVPPPPPEIFTITEVLSYAVIYAVIIVARAPATVLDNFTLSVGINAPATVLYGFPLSVGNRISAYIVG
jgi:hypothetical protein